MVKYHLVLRILPRLCCRPGRLVCPVPVSGSRTGRRHRLLPCHAGFYLENALDPVRAGQRLGDRDDQIRQLHKLDQNLRHIVDQCHNLSLGDGSFIHPHRTCIEEYDRCHVDDDICNRIGECGDLAHKQLHMRQIAVLTLKGLDLFLFLVKGPDDPGARKILSGGPQHTVQPCLHLFKQGHCPHHNAEYHDGERRDRHHENKCRLHVNGKSHHHGAEHDKGRAQKQTQHHIHTTLHLVHIGSHPGDHGGRPQRVDLRVGQSLDMGKKGMFQFRGNTHRRFRRKVLCRDRADQSDHPQQDHNPAHAQHIGYIAAADTLIDDRRHHQRHEQLKSRLQHLKKRRQNCLFLIVF